MREVTINGQNVRHYARLGCKKWSCPSCGPKRLKRTRRAITDKAVEHNLSRFLTLTLDPKACKPEESVEYIRKTWNKFRTSLKRLHGQAIPFITVLEFQKSGYAHLHILIDRFIPQNWISEAWSSVGGGKIVFIKQVDVRRIGPYLSKYLTKDLLNSSQQRKYRRFTTSRGINLFKKPEKGVWKLISASINYLEANFHDYLVDSGKSEDGMLIWFHSKAPGLA